MEASADSYNDLKRDIRNELSSETDLGVLKRHFRTCVSSNRSLQRVNSVGELLCLLEDRDCLSVTNVHCLLDVEFLSGNEKLRLLIKKYNKLHGSDNCCLCNTNVTTHIHPNDDHECDVLNDVSESTVHKKGITDVEEAVRNISLSIGPLWPVLLRELQFKERDIHQIQRQFIGNPQQGAQEALRLWMNQCGQNATVETLDSALNNRNCRRKGLGSHLRKLFQY